MPETYLISSDNAIEHFVAKGYSSERVWLPDFDEYERGKLDDAECKIKYDHIFSKRIEGSVTFYAQKRTDMSYFKHVVSTLEFSKWLENWWYDDDLIVISDKDIVSVFHHSGAVFYLQP